MKRAATTTLLFLLLCSNAFADGFFSMELKSILFTIDTIILVEITENKKTTVEGKFKESVTYTNDIKSKVLSSHVGDFTGKTYNTKYSLVLVEGVWLGIPGSGLEEDMKPGEKYVFLLKKEYRGYSLQRAEKAEMLEKVLQLKKEQVEKDRREAQEQRK